MSSSTGEAVLGERSLSTLRMIMHAAARVLGCGSAQAALVDEATDSLVLRVSIANRDVERLDRVSALLGFQPDGARLPLSTAGSLMVRAVREGRLLVSGRFADLVGEIVPEPVASQIEATIGVNTYAVVPVFGRSRTIGALLFQKPGDSGFAPTDRDLLVAYADRVGADLESQALSQEVQALESLGDVGAPPPALYLCQADLRVDGVEGGGEGAGRTLPELLGLDAAAARALAEAVPAPGAPAHSLAVPAEGGRSRRVTLRSTPAGVIAVVEDVGWLERLGREAARARGHLSRILHSVGEPIFTVDNHGTIVGCNEAVRRAFGRAPSELLGTPLAALYADRRSVRRAERVGARLAADGFAEAELSFRRADGRALPTAVSALLLADDEERPAGALWRLTDLTERRRGDAERKRLRARLLQSERLSALGEMAARIAHEVRNPLVSIGAAARVVEEELPPSSPVLDEARAISREVRRLDGIVSDFLRFARPRQVARAPVDLRALVRETVDLVGARSPAAPMRVETAGDVTARGDADALRQVLWNVLLNAVEASPPGVPIECDLRPAKAGAPRVVVSIANGGKGIPAAIRRRVFDPFFSTKARGTGLGLAVSKQIVDEHGGRIRVLGRPGGGTRVVIELPV